MFPKKQNKKLSTKNYQLKANAGFTLLELVISMAMIAVLTTSAIQIARFSDTHKNLTLAADQMRVAIRSSQSSALSVPNPENLHVCGFGVFFGERGTLGNLNQYELFYTHVDGLDFIANPNACSEEAQYRDGMTNNRLVERHKLPEGVELDASHDQETIFFKAPYGEPFDSAGESLLTAGSQPITLDSSGNTKAIVVEISGKIE